MLCVFIAFTLCVSNVNSLGLSDTNSAILEEFNTLNLQVSNDLNEGFIPKGGFRVGDPLVSLHQGGGHSSQKSGEYEGNGVYKILMKDGGKDRNFSMKFQLIGHGNGEFELKRLDCGDPPTMLQYKGDGVLNGGAYTLSFSN